MAFDSPSGGSTQFGYGDTQISFKYRFIQENKEASRPQVAVFPLVQLPTGDQNCGLGAGDWTTYGGGGYWINQGGVGDKNYWFFCGLLQRKVTDKLSVAGEIFYQTANTIDGDDSTGFNVGAIYDFNEHNHLLFSAGRGFQNTDNTNVFPWYVGFQITWP